MILPFISRKKYQNLALHCLNEQKRTQDAEYQVSKLQADNETLGQLVMHYKRKSDRLEYAVHHPRDTRCRYMPIISMEQLK